MKKRIVILLGALTILLLCSACGSKSNTAMAAQSASEYSLEENEYSMEIQAFIKDVQSGNYLDAIDEYNENVHGNSILENETSLFLQDLLYGTLDAYNCGTKTETDFSNAYATVEKVDNELGIITNVLTAVREEFDALMASKDSYQSGIECMDDSDYLTAANYFSQVVSFDEDYDNAQSSYEEAMNSYVQQIISSAEEKISNGEYDTAIGIIDEAERSTGWQSKYDDLRTEAYTMAAEASVNDAIEANDYPTARAAYESSLDNTYVTFSADMIAKLETAKTDYRNAIKDSARQAADDHDYAGALSAIDDALLVLEDDSELLQFQTEIQTEYDDYLVHTTPVSLADLSPYQQKHMSSSDSKDEDILGNTYDTHLGSNSKNAYATYRIDGIYKTFTGSFYVRTDYSDTPRTVSVYGDGKKLFETTVNGGEDPTQFNVDVTGVRDLTVNMDGDLSWATVLGDPILTP